MSYTPPPRKTITDYLVEMFCPLLIMVMVGSLALFLAKIGYSGRYVSRVNWALCWFVLGSVLISRIGIQQGYERSAVYGLLLGAAISFFFWRFLHFGVPLFVLLGILFFIWWCTSQLTWDCTVIEDDEDSSGQGLLEASGLEAEAAKETKEEEKKHALRRKRKRWWQHLFGSQANRKGQPHAPGIWIILFSLFALPLFGLGQLKFSSGDTAEKRFGFILLGIYVGAGLGLLLLTSFLGLRRYLRQRRLEMPLRIAGSWIISGTILAAVIMGACLLLPRPNARITLTSLVDMASTNLVQQASKHSLLKGDAAEGEGSRKGEGEGEPKGEEQKKGSGEQAGGESKGPNGDSKEQAAGGTQKDPNGGSSSDKKGNASANGNQDGQAQQPQSGEQEAQPSLKMQEDNKTNWVKWLIYGLLALVAAFLIWRYRQQIQQCLAAIWKAIKDFLRNLLHGLKQPPRPEALASKPTGPPLRKFSSFLNPFISGQSQTMAREELVAYTFEALQCWAREHGQKRGHGETPYEFAMRLGQKEPLLSEDLRQLAWFYTRLAYAQQSPPETIAQNAQQLWEFMSITGAVKA